MSGGKGEGRAEETAAYRADGSIIGTKLPRKGSGSIRVGSKQRQGDWGVGVGDMEKKLYHDIFA